MKDKKYGDISKRKYKTQLNNNKKWTMYDLNRKKKMKYLSHFAGGKGSPENRSQLGDQ